MFCTERRQNLEFLKIPNLCLKGIGIDISVLKGKSLIKNHWKFLFLMSCMIYVQFAFVQCIVNTGLAILDESLKVLGMCNECFSIFMKIAVFLMRGDKFMKLLWDINELAKGANLKEKHQWLSNNIRAQLVAKVYFCVCFGGLMSSLAISLVYIAYDFMQNKGFNKYYPFGVQFAYGNDHIIFFTINYSLTCIYMYCIQNILVPLDALYCWYIYAISAHFRILRCKLEDAAVRLQSVDGLNFSQEIAKIVQYHIRILAFVDDLNAVYGEVLLVKILQGSLQMCFAIYAMNNDDNVYNIPYNMMVLLAILFQLLIFCLGGEKIKNESSMLSNDIYLKFPWHSMSVKEKKLMLLPLMRSQKLCVLTTTFFVVDRELLVGVYKTAFSLNTLLTTMRE